MISEVPSNPQKNVFSDYFHSEYSLAQKFYKNIFIEYPIRFGYRFFKDAGTENLEFQLKNVRILPCISKISTFFQEMNFFSRNNGNNWNT